MVWRPGEAMTEQGAVHALCERPSNSTVAPPGLLTTITGNVAEGTGRAGCGAGNVAGCDSGGAASGCV
jgi:hypothetical protein